MTISSHERLIAMNRSYSVILFVLLLVVVLVGCNNNTRVPTTYATPSPKSDISVSDFRSDCTNLATGGGWYYCADGYRRAYEYRRANLSGTVFEPLIAQDAYLASQSCLSETWRGRWNSYSVDDVEIVLSCLLSHTDIVFELDAFSPYFNSYFDACFSDVYSGKAQVCTYRFFRDRLGW